MSARMANNRSLRAWENTVTDSGLRNEEGSRKSIGRPAVGSLNAPQAFEHLKPVQDEDAPRDEGLGQAARAEVLRDNA